MSASENPIANPDDAAKPRAADYPFTTLEPSLGIVELDTERTLTLADIPGALPDAEALMALMAQDKKVSDGELRLVLVDGVGSARVTAEVPTEALMATLDHFHTA